MSGLVPHDDGGSAPARCAFCAAEAVGPCASCHTPVCGDCCTLTEDTSRPWAICLDCDRKKGKSLGGAWGSFGAFLLLILVALALVVAAMNRSCQPGERSSHGGHDGPWEGRSAGPSAATNRSCSG